MSVGLEVLDAQQAISSLAGKLEQFLYQGHISGSACKSWPAPQAYCEVDVKPSWVAIDSLAWHSMRCLDMEAGACMVSQCPEYQYLGNAH